MSRMSGARLSFAALLVGLAFLAPGCSKGPQQLIVGTWKPTIGMDLRMVFNSDGTCSLGGSINGKYQINGNSLVITSPSIEDGTPTNDTFTIVTLDDKNLSLQDSDGKTDYVRVQ